MLETMIALNYPMIGMKKCKYHQMLLSAFVNLCTTFKVLSIGTDEGDFKHWFIFVIHKSTVKHLIALHFFQ